MKILAVDTTSKYLSLAITDGKKVIAGFHRAMDQRQCEQLLPQIDKLLKKAKFKLKYINCIAFSKGPGSLTALRIGAATVKGFALGSKIKVVGIPTLDALAYNIKEEGNLIVPIIDARRGNVYASAYSFKNGKLRRHLKYSVGPVAELLKSIKGDAVFLGDGLAAYRKTIEDNFKHKTGFAPEKLWYPRAETVALLGYELAKKKKFEETGKFVPLYLYPKDVQVRDLKR
ncbi:MAG: tRNA (adenosine(37)-N6)-threonylcarbamoyltransferase complex dimerization subunit type 1 TsaB [Candidatus Omnitrophica bacterium]|nr:tRNA (adenosine(37)-N6)-threonylcarbamoyltransferase complex dimerization subunit type 1 TsaB [Candidatus Omnitrophota bacterium]MDD5311039.1 tRNA (adenosine(37)-N6)-threonylcarbamoyltransferase complex dimerization subunit type 1 TsaB [Candidatus Omnitrophota bacterium]MDD5546537.1 tRNA (adenosine(37)-N6)-threonylcarbamoyltransferase complex dimerization subunit type 1 TsaB [Candidatus Omnitrophota bacterium]